MCLTPSFQQINSMSDFDIIMNIVQDGKSAQFGELYNRYYPKVYAKTFSLVKNQADAEDLTQDIFSKIFLNLAKFEGRASFSTWVYQITFNETMDFFRKNKKQHTKYSLSDVGFQVKDVSEETLLEKQFRDQLLNQLIHTLDGLNEMDKTIISMKYFDDCSVKEIMEVYNISESAVKMRLKRAKTRLQKKYEEQFELAD